MPHDAFPLFLTKRQFLRMLDGTTARPFFPRCVHCCNCLLLQPCRLQHVAKQCLARHPPQSAHTHTLLPLLPPTPRSNPDGSLAAPDSDGDGALGGDALARRLLDMQVR